MPFSSVTTNTIANINPITADKIVAIIIIYMVSHKLGRIICFIKVVISFTLYFPPLNMLFI